MPSIFSHSSLVSRSVKGAQSLVTGVYIVVQEVLTILVLYLQFFSKNDHNVKLYFTGTWAYAKNKFPL